MKNIHNCLFAVRFKKERFPNLCFEINKNVQHLKAEKHMFCRALCRKLYRKLCKTSATIPYPIQDPSATIPYPIH